MDMNYKLTSDLTDKTRLKITPTAALISVISRLTDPGWDKSLVCDTKTQDGVSSSALLLGELNKLGLGLAVQRGTFLH